MSMIATSNPLTTKELLALPDDGKTRWLVRGELREKPATVGNRVHSKLVATLSYLLWSWLDTQPLPRGAVLAGEAGVRLRRDPDSVYGVDVTYISPNLAANISTDTTLIDGVPELMIEILSPSDTAEEIDDKIDDYLDAGVPLVWIVDAHDKTVLAYRPGTTPQLYTIGQEIANEPHLPGLRIAVDRIFE